MDERNNIKFAHGIATIDRFTDVGAGGLPSLLALLISSYLAENMST